MADLAARRVAAVVGALVADAAAQPLHWIYKDEVLDGLIGGKEEIEFWEPSANPFYQQQTGKQSCLGDQSFVVLKSVVECTGLDLDNLKKATYERFGPNSDYEAALTAQPAGTYPIKGPWRNVSVRDFMKNYEAGRDNTGSATDEQIDCVLRIPAVVAFYAGKPEMLDKVEDVVRVTQNADTAVATALAAARILEYYLLNGPSPDAFDEVLKSLADQGRHNPQDLDQAVSGHIREALNKKDKPHREVTSGFGKS